MSALLLAILLTSQVNTLGDSIGPGELPAWYAKNNRPPLLRIGSEMQVGDIGRIPYAFDPAKPAPFVETRVLQVLSDNSELMTVTKYGQVLGGSLKIVSIRTEAIGTATIMVKGISTRNVADGDRVQLPGWWRVDGTESYESAAGKRTVMVIRPFQNAETAAIDAAEKKKRTDAASAAEQAAEKSKADEEARIAKKAEEERAAAAKLRESYRRTWTSKDGKFSVDAYFVDQGGGEVTLERAADGKRITVATSALSAADIDQARILKLKKIAEKP